MRGRTWSTTAIALAVVLAACGTPGGSPGAAPTTASASATTLSERQLVTINGEPVVKCGPSGLPFTPSAYLGPHDHSHADPQIVAALERLVAETGVEVPPALRGVAVKDAPWFVLNQSAQQVDIAVGTWTADGPGRDAMVVDLRWRDGRWWPGWGNCILARVPPPGYEWATVSRGPRGLDKSSPTVTVTVYEDQCTSGRDPSAYLHHPLVVERDTSVVVYWTTTPYVPAPGTGVACPAVAVPRQITLSRPLGDRTVLDGSRWPPAPIGSI